MALTKQTFGHCGTGDCGCGGECPPDACPACCADPAITNSVSIGSDLATLSTILAPCVFFGCWYRSDSPGGFGLGLVLDLNFSPPKLYLRYAYSNSDCTGTYTEFELTLSVDQCAGRLPKQIYVLEPGDPFYAKGYVFKVNA